MAKKYDQIVAASERIAWNEYELLPANTKLNFDHIYLPIDQSQLDFLNKDQQMDLNHILSVSYINLFSFVEEYIIGQVIGLTNILEKKQNKLRALLRFADEEAKHQHLFNRFCEYFNRDFKCRCDLLDSSKDVAKIILGHDQVVIMILTLHLEIITQDHYMEFLCNPFEYDDLYESILKHHWLEESQHTQTDTLIMKEISAGYSQEKFDACIKQYTELLSQISNLLTKQAELNIKNLGQLHPKLSIEQVNIINRFCYESYNNLFVLKGLKNRIFRAILNSFSDNTNRILDKYIQQISLNS